MGQLSVDFGQLDTFFGYIKFEEVTRPEAWLEAAMAAMVAYNAGGILARNSSHKLAGCYASASCFFVLRRGLESCLYLSPDFQLPVHFVKGTKVFQWTDLLPKVVSQFLLVASKNSDWNNAFVFLRNSKWKQEKFQEYHSVPRNHWNVGHYYYCILFF